MTLDDSELTDSVEGEAQSEGLSLDPLMEVLEGAPASAPAPESAPETSSEHPQSVPPLEEQTYGQLYRMRFRDLDPTVRAARARGARDADLIALCLDPDPQVIAALLENPLFGLVQARLVAHWHRTGSGLEILSRRAELVRDSQVQRRLLTNPQLPEPVLVRLLARRRLGELYRLATDRDLPERTRTQIRATLRTRFMNASTPEERAELVVVTEGRVLALLGGCSFDGRTAQLIGARSSATALLVQNLAHFSPTPPPLLLKLLNQPVVRRQPALRLLLLRHPNMPAQGSGGSL